jgi:conjugative relaxase-like TrwC/TraI family protein
VISIGNVVSVRAGVRYFDEALAEKPADYYAARGEAPGVWRGRAAAALRLDGRVQRADFIRVLEGRHPGTGEELGRHHATAKNAAFDVTFSLPKSVSLLYALGDDRVQRAVMRALDAGASAAHAYIEEHAAWGRVYKHSVPEARRGHRLERVRAELVTASFVHRTARPVTRDGLVTVDPQLHAHLIVASFARRTNGSWGQLYSEPLYAHAAAAGAIGQAATRDVLVRELGVRVRTGSNGTFELAGFTEEQLAEFSQRHRQALAAAAASGASSLHGQKVAVLDSRQAKSDIGPDTDLFAQWMERSAAVGLTAESIRGLLDQEQVRELRWFDVETAQHVIGRTDGGLTADRSVFTRRDLVRSLAAHAPLGMRPKPIEELADAILADSSVVTPMVPAQEGGMSPSEAMWRWLERGMELHYSTPEVVVMERRMLASALGRQRERTLVLSAASVETALVSSGERLTADQRAMVTAVCTSAAGVVVVEGAAGTGKTTAARIVRDATAAAGVAVIGCAPSGRAAVTLQEEAGIPSFTVASLLARLRDGEHLARRGLVIADECSMLGPDLAELVLRAEQDGAKLVLMGDSEQLQPIDGGALFKSLGEGLGRIALTEVVRQRELWDREALMALRAGQAAPLVRRYLDDGRVHQLADQPSRIATIAADWVAAAADGNDVITVARERAVVAELNAVTRTAAVGAGLVEKNGISRVCVDSVGRKEVALGTLEFAVGDRVLLVGRNQRRRGLVKGLRGTVMETTADGALILETSTQHRVPVPPDYRGVAHGYALTAHRAQGATADIALVHGSDAADRQWQYVALSRHRIRAAYYDVVPSSSDVDGVHHGQQMDTRRTEDRLITAMSRDGSKATTLDYPGAYDRQFLSSHPATGPGAGVGAAPTEAQLAVLRDCGMVEDLPPAPTWVHASLLVDGVLKLPQGQQAREWLRENGAAPDEAMQAIEVAAGDLRASRGVSRIREVLPAQRAQNPRRAARVDASEGGRVGAEVNRRRTAEERRAQRERDRHRQAMHTRGRGVG